MIQGLENEYVVEWEDLDGVEPTPEAAADGAADDWRGTALYYGMQSLHEHLAMLIDTLATTPLDIRADYEVPQAQPLAGLRQGGYELVEDHPQHRRFWLRFRCVGEGRYSIREASRPARDERVRWLNKRGMSFHVEDDYGSQWHFSLLVRPLVPVSIRFEAEVANNAVRISFANFRTLDIEYRTVQASAITPAMFAELEKLILRRPNRFDEFTGNRVQSDVRARFRAAIAKRERTRAEELGENPDARGATGQETTASRGVARGTSEMSRTAVVAPTFVGPRDDDGALEWTDKNTKTANVEVAAPPRNPNAPPAYAWLITAGGVENTAANLGKHGPPGASKLYPLRRLLTEGKQFRLRNREGKIAFTGKIAGDFKGPEPIADFGVDHGCMRIEYFIGDRWQELGVKKVD